MGGPRFHCLCVHNTGLCAARHGPALGTGRWFRTWASVSAGHLTPDGHPKLVQRNSPALCMPPRHLCRALCHLVCKQALHGAPYMCFVPCVRLPCHAACAPRASCMVPCAPVAFLITAQLGHHRWPLHGTPRRMPCGLPPCNVLQPLRSALQGWCPPWAPRLVPHRHFHATSRGHCPRGHCPAWGTLHRASSGWVFLPSLEPLPRLAPHGSYLPLQEGMLHAKSAEPCAEQQPRGWAGTARE